MAKGNKRNPTSQNQRPKVEFDGAGLIKKLSELKTTPTGKTLFSTGTLLDALNPKDPGSTNPIINSEIAKYIGSARAQGAPIRETPDVVFMDEQGNYLHNFEANQRIIRNLRNNADWNFGLKIFEYNNTMPAWARSGWKELTGDAKIVVKSKGKLDFTETEIKRGGSEFFATENIYDEFESKKQKKVVYKKAAYAYSTGKTLSKSIAGSSQIDILKRIWKEDAFSKFLSDTNGKTLPATKEGITISVRIGLKQSKVEYILVGKVNYSTDNPSSIRGIIGSNTDGFNTTRYFTFAETGFYVVSNWVELEADKDWTLSLEKLQAFANAQMGHSVAVETQKFEFERSQVARLRAETAELVSSKTLAPRELQIGKAILKMFDRKLEQYDQIIETSRINDSIFILGQQVTGQKLTTDDLLNLIEKVKREKRIGFTVVTMTDILTGVRKNSYKTNLTAYLDIGNRKRVILENRYFNVAKGQVTRRLKKILEGIWLTTASPSTAQSAMAEVLSVMPGQAKKLKKYIKRKKRQRITKTHKVYKQVNVKKLKRISKAQKVNTKTKTIAAARRSGSANKSGARRVKATNVAQLVPLLQANIYEAVRAQMVKPALQYRSGRFARSVEITNIDAATSSIMYRYMYDPYEVFSSGTGGEPPWNEETARDPHTIIDNAIKSLGKLYSQELGSKITTMRG